MLNESEVVETKESEVVETKESEHVTIEREQEYPTIEPKKIKIENLMLVDACGEINFRVTKDNHLIIDSRQPFTASYKKETMILTFIKATSQGRDYSQTFDFLPEFKEISLKSIMHANVQLISNMITQYLKIDLIGKACIILPPGYIGKKLVVKIVGVGYVQCNNSQFDNVDLKILKDAGEIDGFIAVKTLDASNPDCGQISGKVKSTCIVKKEGDGNIRIKNLK